MEHIVLNNISKKFDNNIIFDNVSYNFEKGKTYGIIGSNGSGKSVLFKIISGLIFADKGSVIIDGINIGKSGNMPSDFGALIESPGFLPNNTGFQNLKILADINKKVGRERIEEVLTLVSLYNHKDTKVKKYSLGMLQRLGIAQSILENPKLLIIDEPFNSIDETGVKEIKNMLFNYIKNNKVTTFITSHNYEDILHFSDVILKIENSKLVEIKK